MSIYRVLCFNVLWAYFWNKVYHCLTFVRYYLRSVYTPPKWINPFWSNFVWKLICGYFVRFYYYYYYYFDNSIFGPAIRVLLPFASGVRTLENNFYLLSLVICFISFSVFPLFLTCLQWSSNRIYVVILYLFSWSVVPLKHFLGSFPLEFYSHVNFSSLSSNRSRNESYFNLPSFDILLRIHSDFTRLGHFFPAAVVLLSVLFVMGQLSATYVRVKHKIARFSQNCL